VLLDLKIGRRKKITYICRRVVSLEGSGGSGGSGGPRGWASAPSLIGENPTDPGIFGGLPGSSKS
jgi:hypothetical protein